MRIKWLPGTLALLILAATGCKHKPAAGPPPPAPVARENVIVLLPEANGKTGRIVVTNTAGSEALSEAYRAVRVERANVAPSAPFLLDEPSVRRMFGAALDALPAPEVHFVLYFDEGKDQVNAASEAELPNIFQAIEERHSTAVSVIGHTDTTGDTQSNYQLGMRRAQQVATILRARGLDPSSLFVASHGEFDLLVKTPRGVSEQRNRRVEVIVR